MGDDAMTAMKRSFNDAINAVKRRAARMNETYRLWREPGQWCDSVFVPALGQYYYEVSPTGAVEYRDNGSGVLAESAERAIADPQEPIGDGRNRI